MRRRDLLRSALATAALAPFGAAAQQRRVPTIGCLSTASPGTVGPFWAAFSQGLGEGGYAEGQNVAIEYRWAHGHYDRLAALAAELVGRKVDVIVTGGGAASALAAKAATSTIPITFVSADPVGDGLVAGIGRPGGNLTGISLLSVELMPKGLELVSELVPQASTIVLLVNPTNPNAAHMIADGREAARAKGVWLTILTAGIESEIEAAFATLVQLNAGAVVVHADPYFTTRRDQLVALAARHAVPTIYYSRDFVALGGLISYGSSLSGAFHQLGGYVAKILNGATPADLPVQQPTKFELIINMKTAKALGLTIPQMLLAQADEVIE